MKIKPPQPAGARATTLAGISTFVSIALLALLAVATGTFAKTRTGVSQTSGIATGSTSFSLAKPSTATTGSVLLAAVDASVGSASISAPAGWSLVRSDTAESSTGQLTQALYLKVAGATEPVSYTWSFSSAANAGGGIVAYSGVDPVNPIDSASGLAVGNTTKTLTATSLTTSGASDIVVAAFGSGGRPPSAPTGMTLRWNVATLAAASTLADTVQASAGETSAPSTSFRHSGTSLGVVQLVALRAASKAAPPPPPPPAPSSQPPANVAPPSVSGTTTEGQILTASTGSWSGSPASYSYQWRDCQVGGSPCASISGATSASYKLVAADVNSSMRVVVTATNTDGTASASSAPTTIVGAQAPAPAPAQAPANTVLPVISGNATQGQTLTASPGTWSGSPTQYSYAWRSCDTTGSSCTDLGGAAAASIVLTTGQVGRTIRVVVTATNVGGSTSATSSPTAAVAAAPAPPAPPSGDRKPCTIYVSPDGSASASGTTESTATTIAGGYQKMVPGSVVCLMAGTYSMSSPLYMSKGGTASQWVTWQPDGSATPIVKASFATSASVFGFNGSADYIEMNGLTIDGQGDYDVAAAFHTFQGTHHHRFIGDTILNMSAGGIMTTSSDYLTAVDNRIWRFGDGIGWCSGISFNDGNGAYAFDGAPGFHNVIAGNIIGGGVDNSPNDSDGNGIILDLGGNIPATLIANNVIYMNGGRGITTLKVTGKTYVVNNTLYKDGLDTRMSGVAELTANESTNQVWANNIASPWGSRFSYQLFNGASVMFASNDQFGGLGSQYVPAAITGDATQLAVANPLFIAPPSVDASSGGQWRNAPNAAALGSGLALQAGSPLVDTARDPRTLPGLDSAMLAGINQYVMTAIDGSARPRGGGFDYGAYER